MSKLLYLCVFALVVWRPVNSFCIDSDGLEVLGCACDFSCALSDPDDCFTCTDGSPVTVIYEDGSGTCVAVDTGAHVDINGMMCVIVFQMAGKSQEMREIDSAVPHVSHV